MGFFKRKKQGQQESTGSSKAPFIEPDPTVDDRYMNLAVNSHNWQMAWRLTFVLLCVSSGFNGYYMVQSKFIPVPIKVDEMGNTVVIGPVTNSKPIDSERVIRREIEDFIDYSRSRIGDNLLQKKRVHWVANRLPAGSQAAAVVRESYDARPPFTTAENFTYSTDIKSCLRQSDHTWYVEWVETQRSLSGEVVSTQRWKAIVTYELDPQDSYEGIENNPIGMQIVELNWQPMR